MDFKTQKTKVVNDTHTHEENGSAGEDRKEKKSKTKGIILTLKFSTGHDDVTSDDQPLLSDNEKRTFFSLSK